MSDDVNEFFKTYAVKICCGRKKILVSSFSDAKEKFCEYIKTNNITDANKLSKNDGKLYADNEFICVFSYNFRLWDADGEEIIW